MGTGNSSPSMSFEGWDVKVLLSRNKDTIKLLLTFLMGYSYMSGFNWHTWAIGIGSLVGKMVMDSVDFYLTNVELK